MSKLDFTIGKNAEKVEFIIPNDASKQTIRDAMNEITINLDKLRKFEHARRLPITTNEPGIAMLIDQHYDNVRLSFPLLGKKGSKGYDDRAKALSTFDTMVSTAKERSDNLILTPPVKPKDKKRKKKEEEEEGDEDDERDKDKEEDEGDESSEDSKDDKDGKNDKRKGNKNDKKVDKKNDKEYSKKSKKDKKETTLVPVSSDDGTDDTTDNKRNRGRNRIEDLRNGRNKEAPDWFSRLAATVPVEKVAAMFDSRSPLNYFPNKNEKPDTDITPAVIYTSTMLAADGGEAIAKRLISQITEKRLSPVKAWQLIRSSFVGLTFMETTIDTIQNNYKLDQNGYYDRARAVQHVLSELAQREKSVPALADLFTQGTTYGAFIDNALKAYRDGGGKLLVTQILAYFPQAERNILKQHTIEDLAQLERWISKLDWRNIIIDTSTSATINRALMGSNGPRHHSENSRRERSRSPPRRRSRSRSRSPRHKDDHRGRSSCEQSIVQSQALQAEDRAADLALEVAVAELRLTFDRIRATGIFLPANQPRAIVDALLAAQRAHTMRTLAGHFRI